MSIFMCRRQNLRMLSRIARRYSKWDLKSARVVSTEPLSDPRWVEAKRAQYITPNGNRSTWEFCSRKRRERSTKQQVSDAVAILAILSNHEQGPQIVVQRQYRVPVNGVCIEMPAGLLDPGETVEECAVRELQEETGYIGVPTRKSPPLFNDTGFSDNTVTLVTVTVDINDPRNQNPQPHLENNEFIETFVLPLNGLRSHLDGLQGQGFNLCARLYDIAAGADIVRGSK